MVRSPYSRLYASGESTSIRCAGSPGAAGTSTTIRTGSVVTVTRVMPVEPSGRVDWTNSVWLPLRKAARTASATSAGAGIRRTMTFPGLGCRWTSACQPSPAGARTENSVPVCTANSPVLGLKKRPTSAPRAAATAWS
ncbi:hypothetical protein ACFQ0M_10130 [Kitasatospora aburaviensis]